MQHLLVWDSRMSDEFARHYKLAESAPGGKRQLAPSGRLEEDSSVIRLNRSEIFVRQHCPKRGLQE